MPPALFGLMASIYALIIVSLARMRWGARVGHVLARVNPRGRLAGERVGVGRR